MPAGRDLQLCEASGAIAGVRLAVGFRMNDLHDTVPLPDPNFDRPRERLWRRGTQTVGDEELLSVVLGTGVANHSALAVAGALVRTAGGIAALSRASPRELALVTGVGEARAARVAAAFELGRRAVESVQHRAVLCEPADVYRCVGPRLAGLAQEVFLAIGIDVRNGVLDVVEVARGSVATVEVHPREVFRPLIRMAAAGGVLVHNHPTGDPTPSHEDIELTRRLREVGGLLGIPIVDHVVIGDRAWRSVAELVGMAMP
jgi:DNA repair protein RadC